MLLASRRVKEDLEKYGFQTSDDKSSRGARWTMKWTGFLWDTKNFKLFLLEDKQDKAEGMIVDLLQGREKFIEVKNLAGVDGFWYRLFLEL